MAWLHAEPRDGGIGCERPVDIAYAVSVENDWTKLLLRQKAITDPERLGSRLKVLSGELREEHEKKKAVKLGGDHITDFDSILSAPELTAKRRRFWLRYHVAYPPEVEPADLVVSRLTNEIAARAVTVRDLKWVKSMAQQINSKKKEERITETLRHVVSDLTIDTETSDVDL